MTKRIKLYKFFLFFLSISLFVFGIIILNDKNQSISIMRIFLFSYLPLFLSLIILICLFNTTLTIIVFNTILLSFSVIATFEIYLIYKYNKNRIEIDKADNELYYSLYKENKFQEKQICPSIFLNSNFFNSNNDIDILPLAGISNNLIKFYNKFSKIESIRKNDKYGFNNTNKNWNYDNYFAVFLGDSFTFGSGVNHKEGFVDLFKQKYDNSLNLACYGNGPILEMAIFKEYVRYLKPKKLIWVFYENDLSKDLNRERHSPYKKYLDKNYSQDLINNQKKIDIFIKKYLRVQEKKYNSQIVESNSHNYQDFYKLVTLRTAIGLKHGYDIDSLNTLKQILREVNIETKKWDGELIFVIIPQLDRYKNFISYLDAKSYEKPIINFLKDEDINFIELEKELKKYGNYKDFYFGHFNKKGNEIVSKILIEKIK